VKTGQRSLHTKSFLIHHHSTVALSSTLYSSLFTDRATNKCRISAVQLCFTVQPQEADNNNMQQNKYLDRNVIEGGPAGFSGIPCRRCTKTFQTSRRESYVSCAYLECRPWRLCGRSMLRCARRQRGNEEVVASVHVIGPCPCRLLPPGGHCFRIKA
jgi:hypothetical protein